MKTFQQFKQDMNEGVATLAIPAGVGVLKKIAASSALKYVGAGALTGAGYLAAKKASEGPFSGTGGFDASKSRTKRQYLGLPPSTDLTKNQKKNRKIKGQQDIINKRDDQIAREGPGDLVPGAKRARLKELLKKYLEKSGIQRKRDANKQIDDRIKAIDDFKKTSKQKRSEKKTRKVENKRSELANRREWENLKSQGQVSGDYDPNYFNK
tara:strand:- start:188 stop:817 length:630 start_codon:yes stop_codon:yes gene_type:complete